jgi:phenylpropionate dioxygenase-like ring-hydroxylating dioxygenase large terminal subunit
LLPEIPFFKDLRQGFAYGQFTETWPVHYTRAIENQLDVVHLPFVHYNSIGRGCRTLVNGPVVTWEDNLMTFYVDNVVDDGRTKPLKPQEIPDYRDLFSLQLQMPNLWQNRIGDKVRIVAVFAPVDDTHTRIYLRFYQSFMTLPILRGIIGRLSNIGNRYILHQDRRVVVTQRPVKSGLHMGENLVQGDAPIIEFRKEGPCCRKRLKGAPT